MGVEPKIGVGFSPPQIHGMLIGFSVFHYFHHPFWGGFPPIFGNTQILPFSEDFIKQMATKDEQRFKHIIEVPQYMTYETGGAVCNSSLLMEKRFSPCFAQGCDRSVGEIWVIHTECPEKELNISNYETGGHCTPIYLTYFSVIEIQHEWSKNWPLWSI